MADSDEVVRRALDAMDRRRRWTLAAVAAVFAVTAVSLAMLFGSAANAARTTSNPAILKSIFVATVTEMLFVACCTIAVLIHVSRLARAIVQAVDRESE